MTISLAGNALMEMLFLNPDQTKFITIDLQDIINSNQSLFYNDNAVFESHFSKIIHGLKPVKIVPVFHLLKFADKRCLLHRSPR